MSIILFTVITIGQYVVSWAAYLEKRYTYVRIILKQKIKRLLFILITKYLLYYRNKF